MAEAFSSVTSGDDLILGTQGDDKIFALNGNDSVVGLSSNDSLFGDDGKAMTPTATINPIFRRH